jgi:hypothetical protein
MNTLPQHSFVASSRARVRRGRYDSLERIEQRWEIENELVRTCSADSNPALLAAEVAAEFLRRYDAELSRMPAEAWGWLVTIEERAELKACFNSHRVSPECASAAKLIADGIHKQLLSDEAFMVAMAAVRHLRVGRRS